MIPMCDARGRNRRHKRLIFWGYSVATKHPRPRSTSDSKSTQNSDQNRWSQNFPDMRKAAPPTIAKTSGDPFVLRMHTEIVAKRQKEYQKSTSEEKG